MPRSRSIDCVPAGCLRVPRMCIFILLSSIFASFWGGGRAGTPLGRAVCGLVWPGCGRRDRDRAREVAPSPHMAHP